MKRLLVAGLMVAGMAFAQRGPAAPPQILLWENGAPGALGDTDADKPSLTVLRPRGRQTQTAVVICPGGGYQTLAFEKEGTTVGQWFNSLGVTAFVLRYRLGPKYHHPVELGDVLRALRMVRSRADEFGVSANQIGVMGFSAGGHLASSAATLFEGANASAADPVDRVSSRPDFAILGYPVISMTAEYTHAGSRRNLLGENPSPDLMRQLSTEFQVRADTPPTFLFQTTADTTVPAENAVAFYLALRKQRIPAEMHIYENGPHGVGLAPTDAVLSTWPQRLSDWLRGRGLLNFAK